MNSKPHPTNVIVRECITTALFTLMESQDFHKITVTNIIRKAGVARVSFYRNYTSKEAVIMAYFNSIVGEIAKLHSIQFNTYTLEEMGLISFRFFKTHKKTILLIKQARMVHLIDETFESLFDLFEMPDGMPNTKYAKLYYWGGFMSMAMNWVETGMVESESKMTEIYCRLIRHVDAHPQHRTIIQGNEGTVDK